MGWGSSVSVLFTIFAEPPGANPPLDVALGLAAPASISHGTAAKDEALRDASCR